MTDIQVIKRDTIPPITSIEEGGAIHRLGELRDFSWSEPLRTFMGGKSAGFSASWVQLADGEVLDPHVHPVLSMMVFYAGSGELIGDLQRPLCGDEVVVVPPGCLHGFIGGPSGLFGLSIQFAGGLYSTPEKPRVVFSSEDASLDQLVGFSDKRASDFCRKPMFDIFADSTLSSPLSRRAFMDALQVWLDGVEALLVARHASCADPKYQSIFRRRLVDLNRRESLRKRFRNARRITRDSALDAIASWFSYQMYVLDNVEKTAIVSLVVDKANKLLRSRVASVLGEKEAMEAFGPEVDTEIASEMELLNRETPQMYTRLTNRVSEAWDMAEAMSDRIAALTRTPASARGR